MALLFNRGQSYCHHPGKDSDFVDGTEILLMEEVPKQRKRRTSFQFINSLKYDHLNLKMSDSVFMPTTKPAWISVLGRDKGIRIRIMNYCRLITDCAIVYLIPFSTFCIKKHPSKYVTSSQAFAFQIGSSNILSWHRTVILKNHTACYILLLKDHK